MTDDLPPFRYHPDPVGTESVLVSDVVCVVCERSRGYIYVGPVFAVEDVIDEVCPWCIADGAAAERFDAEFTDAATEAPAGVPVDVMAEVARRTPGFDGWQQEHWLYHCNDAAAYIGQDRAGDASTYRFRCLHCAAALSYTDRS